MTAALQTYHNQASNVVSPSTPGVAEIRKMGPSQARETISELFAQGHEVLAYGLADAALTLYPQSEDVLVISALLAEVKREWDKAEQLLIRLIEVQGCTSTEAAWTQLIRVLRCQNKFGDAELVARHAIDRFTDSQQLHREAESLQIDRGVYDCAKIEKTP